MKRIRFFNDIEHNLSGYLISPSRCQKLKSKQFFCLALISFAYRGMIRLSHYTELGFV
jgi:hypothetical protein